MKQSSIEKLHAEGSELISRHLNGKISARDLIIMYHNLYYDAKEMHKQEIIEAFDRGLITENVYYGFDDMKAEKFYKNTYEKEN